MKASKPRFGPETDALRASLTACEHPPRLIPCPPEHENQPIGDLR